MNQDNSFSKEKSIKVCFELAGGLGDIILALNYIQQFQAQFHQALISISVAPYFYEQVQTLIYNKDFISNVYKHEETFDTDILLYLIRPPLVKYMNNDKVSKNYPALYEFMQKIVSFNATYDEMTQSEVTGYHILEEYTIIQNRNRIAESDIEGLLNIKDEYKIYLKPELDEKILAKFNITKPFITVNRGVGVTDGTSRIKSTRVWPIESYIELIKTLKKDYPDYLIVQVGDALGEEIEGVDLNICGKTTFDEALYLLNEAGLHIDGECGSVHFRHFLSKKPSLVLFGPTNIKFYGYPENINIRSQVCQGCEWLHKNWRTKCLLTQDSICYGLEKLSVSEVVNALKEKF